MMRPVVTSCQSAWWADVWSFASTAARVPQLSGGVCSEVQYVRLAFHFGRWLWIHSWWIFCEDQKQYHCFCCQEWRGRRYGRVARVTYLSYGKKWHFTGRQPETSGRHGRGEQFHIILQHLLYRTEVGVSKIFENIYFGMFYTHQGCIYLIINAITIAM